MVPLSLCMSLFGASREQPLATGLGRASSQCLPDRLPTALCATLSGWRRAMMRWQSPRTGSQGRPRRRRHRRSRSFFLQAALKRPAEDPVSPTLIPSAALVDPTGPRDRRGGLAAARSTDVALVATTRQISRQVHRAVGGSTPRTVEYQYGHPVTVRLGACVVVSGADRPASRPDGELGRSPRPRTGNATAAQPVHRCAIVGGRQRSGPRPPQPRLSTGPPMVPPRVGQPDLV